MKNYKRTLLASLIVSSGLILVTLLIHVIESSIVNSDSLYKLVNELTQGFQLRQIILIVVLFVYGYFLLLPFGEKFSINEKFFLAFPTAISVWVVTSHFMMIIGIKYNGWSCSLFLLVLLIVRYFIYLSENNCIKLNIINILPVCVLVIGLASFVSSGILLKTMSADSYHLIAEFGWMIGKHGAYVWNMADLLTSTATAPAIISSIGYFFGFESTLGIQYFLEISMIGYLLLICKKLIIIDAMKKSVLFRTLSLIMLFSCNAFIVMCGWLISNAYWMVYTTLFILLLYRKIKYNREISNTILILFSFMITLSRAEGSLFVGLICVCMIVGKKSVIDIITIVIANSIIVVVFYYRIFIDLKYYESEFLSPKVSIIIVSLLLFIISYIAISFKSEFIRTHNTKIVEIGIVLLVFLVSLFNQQQTLINIRMTAANMGISEWGLTPWVLLLFLLFIIINGIKNKMLFLTVVSPLCVSFSMNCIRFVPLRFGIGDSFNRFIICMLPMISFWILTEINGDIELCHFYDGENQIQ